MPDEVSYKLAPGVEIVRLPKAGYLLHSDFVALELAGDEAETFVEKVLTQLALPKTAVAIAAALPEYTLASVSAQLERLRTEGVLTTAGELGPHEAAFEEIGQGAQGSRQRLAAARVAVFGLEGHGAHLAAFLARLGVGKLTLVDPFPFMAAHLALTPFGNSNALGEPRESVAAQTLAREFPDLQVDTAGGPLDEALVNRLVKGASLVVACFDRSMSAAHHWINRACLNEHVVALFSDVRATTSVVGPLVVPGQSACFMCFRMRSVATSSEFERMMALEEHLNRQRQPNLAGRPLLPALCLQAAAALGEEVVRTLLRIEQPILADRTLVHDALLGAQKFHSVLRVAECPACGEKKKPHANARLSELLADDAQPADLLALANKLVSPRTGILTELTPLAADPSEPARPFVYRVHIANHQFLSERDDDRAICSGKGATVESAMISALGEGIERYAAARWSPDEVIYAAAGNLDGAFLDPRRLVLYDETQYAALPYRPYSTESVLGWVRARSLVSDDAVWVPASAALMDYAVHDAAEFLFPITSNGLAAGPTLPSAVLSAIYEVLERDAFMLTWLHRWPGQVHDAAQHPEPEVRELSEAYRRRSVRLELVRLPTDHPVAVFAAIAFQQGGRGGPGAVVGLGADMDPVIAARKAAMEVAQVRPTLRRRSRVEQARRVAELADDPTKVETLEDHALLYASTRHVSALGFLCGEPRPWNQYEHSRASANDAKASLASLISFFSAQKQDVLYVDLSSRDLQPLGLHCARAILPDFQPIWFGHREARLGGTRVRELPARLGYSGTPVSLSALNPLPHPLA